MNNIVSADAVKITKISFVVVCYFTFTFISQGAAKNVDPDEQKINARIVKHIYFFIYNYPQTKYSMMYSLYMTVVVS